MATATGQADVIVLGAGIVGVSVALHLQERGRRVLLIDRGEPGAETSHGNAGLIERSSVVPYAFPRDLATLASLASNRSIAVRYRPAALLRMAPWLARYWWNSAPNRLDKLGRAILPLIERCIEEHRRWTKAAGTEALMRGEGWIELYRSRQGLDAAIRGAVELAAYGLSYDLLDDAALRRLEPGLISGSVSGAVHWRDPVTVSDPGAVTRAYAALFVARGGQLKPADAASLQQDNGAWRLSADGHNWQAPETVVASAGAVNASLWLVVVAAGLGGGLVGGLTRWSYVARTADRIVLLRCKPFTARPVAVVADLRASDLQVIATTGLNTRLRAGTVIGTVPKRWTGELKALTR